MKLLKIFAVTLIFVMLAGVALADKFMTSVYYHDEQKAEDIEFFWQVKNTGDSRQEDVQVKMTILGLGEYYTSKQFDLRKSGHESGFALFWLDYDVEPGEYVVRYTVENEEERRTKHRFVYIE